MQDEHRYLPSTAVFLVEALKLVVCLTIALYETSASVPRSMPATSILGSLASSVFAGDSWKMAFPATLYTLANSLQYVGISNLDAATFHVTYQFKIFITAVFSVALLSRKISGRQWLSLLLLMVGVAIVSLPHNSSHSLASTHHGRIYMPRSTNPLRDHFRRTAPESHLKKRSATYEGIAEDEMALDTPGMDASLGLSAVVGVCICSGLAGVYFEKVIKEAHHSTSLWVRNVQLSTYSLFPAFFIGIVFLDGETVAKYGFFAGYNWVVVLSIIIQSFGSIVSAFCIFYADNISKNFAVSISMVLSSLASFVFFDFSMTGHVSTLTLPPGEFSNSRQFLLGASTVLLATWVYNSEEARMLQIPKMPTIEDEKTMMGDHQGMNDMSIQIPKTPLLQEETALATSRPGSPSRKKRNKENLGYFSKHHD
jgi:drug/metabolite transporter (DMT)-like permease